MPDSNFFKAISPITIEAIAKIANAEIQNNADSSQLIKGVAPIDAASDGEITFLSNKKYSDSLKQSKATACIMHKSTIDKAPDGMTILIAADPYLAFAKIATVFYPDVEKAASISDKAYIDGSASIGEGCYIEAGAFIGANVKIGKNTKVHSGAYISDSVQVGENCVISHSVTLSHTIIGNNVILHPGVKIGQDGFGFATEHGKHIKVPQLGRVIIEDNVEIGANSCLDRGAGPDTIIGEGTKIDNLVQIGHNVQTGKGCIIVSHVGISGSTKLGDYVVLGGQVGVAGHLNIGSMANVAAQSGIAKDVAPKEIVGGSPAVPIRQWHRQTAMLQNLVKNKGK